MVLEMSNRQLLNTGPTRQTGHGVLGNALLPVDWLWLCLWCCNSNDTIRVFLSLQCEKTAIGLLKRRMHLLWGEFLCLNLCKNKIFCHLEEGLGHEIFLNRCREGNKITFLLSKMSS